MNKTQYIQPVMTVVRLNSMAHLLAGSDLDSNALPPGVETSSFDPVGEEEQLAGEW